MSLHRRNPNRECLTCGNEYHSYNKQSKFCSWSCSSKSSQNIDKLKRISLLPRKARVKTGRKKIDCTCSICGVNFISIGKKNKTCSLLCANKQKSISISRELVFNKTCEFCGNKYHSYNKNRLYCSYSCSIDSGTSIRAGRAAVMAMKKYGAKKDANHNEIVSFFRENNVVVNDLSSAGFGVPDLIVFSDSQWRLVEIKNLKTAYGKSGLNKVQKKWAENWQGGVVFIITSIDDAKLFIDKKYNELRQFPPLKS